LNVDAGDGTSPNGAIAPVASADGGVVAVEDTLKPCGVATFSSDEPGCGDRDEAMAGLSAPMRLSDTRAKK
jgi:hypothetical protein